MVDKYYTPTIEEFHIGFEFYEDINGEKFKQVFGEMFTELRQIENGLSNGSLYVKYLDKEDIESLGWESGMHVNIWSDDDDIVEGWSIAVNNTDTYVLFYSPENNTVGIYLQRVYNEVTGNWTSHIMFSGIIQNKSELKKLMKMINIF